MTIHKSLRSFQGLCLGAVWFVGCTFAVDPELIGDDAGKPPTINEPDASPERDAGRPDPQGPGDAGPDGCVGPSCGSCEGPECPCDGIDCWCEGDDCGCQGDECPPPPVPCDGDDDCGESEYCAANDRCAPLCDDSDVCAGPIMRWTVSQSHLVSDGERVYWDSDDGTDIHGNPRADEYSGRFSWDGVTAPRKLEDAPGAIAGVASGYLYSAGAEGVYRTRVDGVEQPLELEAAAARAWVTADHAFWSKTTDSGAELWRIAHEPAATPELVGSAAHDGWLTGNSFAAFRGANQDQLQTVLRRAPHSDLASEEELSVALTRTTSPSTSRPRMCAFRTDRPAAAWCAASSSATRWQSPRWWRATPTAST